MITGIALEIKMMGQSGREKARSEIEEDVLEQRDEAKENGDDPEGDDGGQERRNGHDQEAGERQCGR